MGKLKIGVFGAGRGMTMVRQLFKSEDAELVAVCDKYQPILDRCRREAEAAGMDKVRYFPDFDSFIESDMDAVIMANYANEHAPFARRRASRGDSCGFNDGWCRTLLALAPGDVHRQITVACQVRRFC